MKKIKIADALKPKPSQHFINVKEGSIIRFNFGGRISTIEVIGKGKDWISFRDTIGNISHFQFNK